MIFGFIAGGKEKVPQLEPKERADLLQWAEGQRAGYVADAIASFAYGRGDAGKLTPEDNQRCQKLGALALRSAKPEWVQAAMKHAVDECARAIDAITPTCSSVQTGDAEAITVKVLQAYLGILDGSIVLPSETYLSITKDAVL